MRIFNAICLRLRRSLAALLAFALLSALSAVAFAEDAHQVHPYMMTVRAGENATQVRAYDAGYENNVYLSLLDLSYALNGTAAQFSFAFGKTAADGEYHTLNTGEPALTQGTGITQDDPSVREAVYLVFKRNRLFVNGSDRKYYTYREGGYDLYMSLVDIELLLDIRVEYAAENTLCFYPGESFAPDYDALAAAGYFDYLNSYAVGDADTGKLIYSGTPNTPVAIASTSKLMTYLLLAEARDRGEFSFAGTVCISADAAELSKSSDGIVNLEAGWNVPVTELLNAMLVASSNESALALAEALCGTEEAFVARMNARARELGLRTAEFYTCNGLPLYEESVVPAKLQNRMSAADLFSLSAYILNHFPEITEITSQTYIYLPTLSYSSANSNPLVFNFSGVTGLKTGSTIRAGQCLAASLPVTVGGETHNLVLIVLGAENGSERAQEAEILLRCAKRMVEINGFPVPVADGR